VLCELQRRGGGCVHCCSGGCDGRDEGESTDAAVHGGAGMRGQHGGRFKMSTCVKDYFINPSVIVRDSPY
jgi:hypothetical protein